MALGYFDDVDADSCLIVALRHGETDWNVQGRIQGQLDIELNDTGRAQCRNGAKALLDMGFGPTAFSKVITSPLKRAAESGDIVAKTLNPELQVESHPGLMEWNAGLLQGKLTTEIKSDLPECWRHWVGRTDADFDFGGESVRCRAERIVECFKNIADLNLGKRVLVVTHAGVLSDLFRVANGLDLVGLLAIPKKNAGIHIFKVKPKQASIECLYWAGYNLHTLVNQPMIRLTDEQLSEGLDYV